MKETLKGGRVDDRIERFVQNPTETLNTERKQWADLSDIKNQSVFIKNCIALYNINGGLLVLGVDDAGKDHPTLDNEKLREIYTGDLPQELVSKYSSESIELDIQLHAPKDNLVVFVIVPSGVKRPAFIKKQFLDPGAPKNKQVLLEVNDIYIRSLKANNRVSTTKINAQHDWDRLFETCMENREADIAKFIQKHLTINQMQVIKNGLMSLNYSVEPSPDVGINYLDAGYKVFAERIKGQALDEHGYFEVAFTINDEHFQHIEIKKSMLEKLKACDSRPRGWPLWVILLNSSDEAKQPTKWKDRYDALIIDRYKIDFWIISRDKWFYHYRAFQDDINGASNPYAQAARLNTIDYVWQTYLVADGIYTALSFAKALGVKVNHHITLYFRWSKLKGRTISAWANPEYEVNNLSKSNEDNCEIKLNIPINTSKAGISSYAYEAIDGLFSLFGGEEIDKQLIEKLAFEHLS